MNCDFDKSSQQEADQDRRLGKLVNFDIHDAQVPGPKINADRNGSGTYATILRGEVRVMKNWLILTVAALFLLTACSNTNSKETPEETSSEENTKVQSEDSVGFEMIGDKFVEAENVPADEKVKILAAFDEYIHSFNAKDIDRYGNVLSKHATGFDYDEEIEMVKATFKNHDVKLVESDATIIKYSENEAQVAANIDYHVKENGTDATLNRTVRQVTIFVKENDGWKITRIVGMEKLDQ